ncbi:MAG: tetratricopeptide repeat protein [Archangium sp.]
MNAALRQATYVGPAPTARPRDEKTDPHILAATVVPPTEAPRKQPLVLGGKTESQDADLWSVSQPATTITAPAGVESFEEALRRVDSSLEALVGSSPAASSEPIEPIIEAEVISPGPTPPPVNVAARIDAASDSATSDSAEQARLRRQRLLKRAMENLSSMPTSSGSGVNSSGSGITAPPPSSPSAPTIPTPSAAEQQLAAQIEARFAQLTKKDPFLTLGVAPTANRDQVKAAFLGHAKTFHPDRLPPSLPHLAQKMSAVFESIRESYETLYDDQKRAAFTSAQQSKQSNRLDPQQAQQASDLFKMAEVFFKKRDYRQAEAHYARAHAIDKGASSLAAQGWAIYMDPARRSEAQAARALMQKALGIDANNDRAHYQLGVIARVEGDMDRAERHFREAVRVNPKHLEANQELRLIEMRKKKAATEPKKGGGFFG